MKYLDIPYFPIPDILDNYFMDMEKLPLYVIIIGANTGELEDFLSPYLNRENLTALLVEPVTELFDKLAAKFQNHKSFAFENSAIGRKNSRSTIYRIANDSANAEWQAGLGSLHKEVILSHHFEIDDIDRRIVKEKINMITFDALIKKHHVDTISILQIDTEGNDFEIIKSIDFNKIKPDIIIFEFLHLTFYQFFACLELLENQGYLLNKNIHSFDVIAVNKALL